MYRVIVVEGVDCSGKGEVCGRLAARLNARLYKSPPEHMRAEQEFVNRTASDEDHYAYFTRVTQAASVEVEELVKVGHVVVDRYWMTTVVYHRVMGVPARLEDMGAILMPDLTVYLTVNPEVQQQRMEGRGMSEGDKRMDGRQHLIRDEYDRALQEAPGRVFRIDTSERTPDEIVDMIIREVASL